MFGDKHTRLIDLVVVEEGTKSSMEGQYPEELVAPDARSPHSTSSESKSQALGLMSQVESTVQVIESQTTILGTTKPSDFSVIYIQFKSFLLSLLPQIFFIQLM